MKNSRKRIFYKFLSRAYHLIPHELRELSFLRALSVRINTHFPHHDQIIYTRDYYETHVEEAAHASYPAIAKSLINTFPMKSVIDFGSGTGALLENFRLLKVTTIGLEQSDAGRELSSKRGVNALSFDIRFDDLPKRKENFDLACCFEVAEHIDAKYSDRLVKLLTEASDRIAFTAAPPGQGGYDHVNEQPKDWWISKFNDLNYQHLNELSQSLAKDWARQGVQDWYYLNLMIFERAN